MSGVVTAGYDVPVGEAWSSQSVGRLKSLCDSHGLAMEVIESIPVHEDIKTGGTGRDRYIENYCKNIRTVASYGVRCVCYNFMPVFDWLRTDMHFRHADGSDSLAYSHEDFAKVDPENLHLPGWDDSYSSSQLQDLLKTYSHISHEQLFENLVYFLERVIPVCEETGVNMAIHPDDPPWDVFGLPRIISNEKDLDRLFAAVPSVRNGLTLCTGSLGAGRQNDLVHMAAKYASQGRVHFLHLRNVLYTDDKDSFCEVGHFTKAGSLNMAAIVRALAAAGAKVALLDRNVAAAERQAEEIQRDGGVAKGYEANVLEKSSLAACHAGVLADFGKCDILINGAGGNNLAATTDKEYFEQGDIEGSAKSFFDLTYEGVSFVFDLNFMGTFLTVQEFARDMTGRSGCNILNISSMNAFTPLTKIPAYSGAKAAISNFTQWLAVHFAKAGVRVNAIAPGFLSTAQNAALLWNADGTPTERTKKIIAATPMGRFGEPDELLGSVLFLVSDRAAGFITGIVLPIDGGFSAYSGV